MKFKSLSFTIVFALSVFLIGSVWIYSQEFQKTDKLKVEKLKVETNPLFPKPAIGMIQQDISAGEVIEVNGKYFGEPQGNRKIFLGNQEGDVKHWYNGFIELRFPASPILGKKIPFVIKTGNIVISNTRLKKLMANLEKCVPDKIRLGNLKMATVNLEALWCGSDKNNIKIRFKGIAQVIRPRPIEKSVFFGKIISMGKNGTYTTIKVALPPKIIPGKYRIHIMQGRRIASDGDPVYLTILPKINLRQRSN